VVTAAWAERLTSLLPHTRLETLPGYAHMAHYSGALALAAVLRPFLGGCVHHSRRPHPGGGAVGRCPGGKTSDAMR
jgi:hypothetical protein